MIFTKPVGSSSVLHFNSRTPTKVSFHTPHFMFFKVLGGGYKPYKLLKIKKINQDIVEIVVFGGTNGNIETVEMNWHKSQSTKCTENSIYTL